ncbi:hypothetical protein J5N97_014000 [Dioscorea zingiberensis]|uniref:Uncharacterized protein n=1 Tax=Dioscorea zingiberensis TaxID=325984 RepID=A0A9D5HJA4_9LILI|nr:hypothetical protein J5N97_014000 [Dioscorea zingiberensis]
MSPAPASPQRTFNKDYKVARDKPFPLYKMIHELAGSSTATGQYASHTGCGEYTNTPVVEVAESTDSSGKHTEEEVDKNKDPVQQASEKGPCKASGSSKRKKVRNSSTTGSKRRSQEQTIEMVDKLMDLSTQRSIIAKELKSKDDSCAYGDCIEVLKSMPDITDEELFIGGKALRSRRDRIWFMKMWPSA